MKKIDLFEESTLEECYEKTGKAPVSTKWVDVNKNTEQLPDVRCRLVARDFKPRGEKDREDLFAAMPPLECKKILFKKAIMNDEVCRRKKRHERLKLMFVDVKKAHLNGVVPEDEFVYIDLDGKCLRLKRWLYGMRPAAAAWEADYAEKLRSVGFQRGRAAPTIFYCEELQVRGVVHGDDFTFLGYLEDLKVVEEHMRSWYDLKVRGILGDEKGDLDEIVILNRTIRWRGGVIEYEADKKHVIEIIKQIGLEAESKGVDTPTVKETLADLELDGEELERSEATRFRAIAARGNYLAQDRIDMQYAAKEVCRDMATPRKRSWIKLKRLARYLMEYPTLIITFHKVEKNMHEVKDVIDVYSDSDWAGCLRTRKSTSGGVASLYGSAIKTWSGTQATIAQSSGEAEYYALVRAAAEGLGIQSFMRDLGYQSTIRIWVDSSAAKSISSRMGLGKIRHLEVKFLWVQESVKEKRFQVRKIRGDCNPADVLTKPKSVREMKDNDKLLKIGVTVVKRQGRKWADMEDDGDLGPWGIGVEAAVRGGSGGATCGRGGVSAIDAPIGSLPSASKE